MKKLVRNSMLVGAAVLGIGSLGTVAQAATTPEQAPEPQTSTASANITPGGITLSAPSFQFGTVAASANDTSYTSTSTGYLKIANAGNGAGYTVTVTASSFKAEGGAALKNAQLILNNNEANLSNDDTNNVSKLPTPVTSELKLITSSPVTVLSAAAGEGVGAYTKAYSGNDVHLEVPAGNIAGKYTSTLTWTLGNAPA